MSAHRTAELLFLWCLRVNWLSRFCSDRGSPYRLIWNNYRPGKFRIRSGFSRWDATAMRCNLDDPTEYTQVKLDYEGDLSLHSTSANKQIEALDIE
jgi:hypothetical protein